jgi:GNAT superfamily N-acetyltransferase
MRAPALKERRVEVVAGLDEAQVCAAFQLHTEQARERGFTLDGRGWADEIRGKVAAGTWNVGIAWDGDRPVGVTEMHVEYDPMLQKHIAWGQRAYVLPEYRTADVFKAIFDFGMNASAALGITTRRCIAETDFYGQAMKRFYESRGFKVVGYVMESA